MPNVIEELAEARKKVESLAAENTTLKAEKAINDGNGAKLGTVSQELAQALADLAKAQGELGVANANLAKVTGELASAKSELAGVDAKIETAASAKAVQIVAAGGGGAIVSKPAENPGNPEKDAKGVKGFAKVRAAFAAQLKK